MFALALASGVFGALLIAVPFQTTRMLVGLTGLALLADGIENICATAYTVRVVQRKKGLEF